MIYRGYKIEESPNPKWGWNVYRRLTYVNTWVWVWAYGSQHEAKAMIDAHFKMEG